MRRGTEDAWIAAYRETVRPLYAFVARRSGGDRALAEDVTQEAWLRAVDAWRRKGPPERPLAWLETVAHNLLRNHFRRRRPESVDPARLDLEELRGEELPQPAARLLQWGLARLATSQARLLEARHLEGQSLESLARELGSSVRAVEGRLRRSRHALQRHLSPHLRAEGERR